MTTASREAARTPARASGCTEHAAERRNDAVLLVSELLTNSVPYGIAPLWLAIEGDGGGLKVRVRDGAPALPQRRHHYASEVDEAGRGMALVDALSAAWGVEPVNDEHRGWKAVWPESRAAG